jgi:hypothetical protein
VVSYSLTAHLDPDSGFEFSRKPSETQMTLFTCGGNKEPMRELGSCGLPIRKRR